MEMKRNPRSEVGGPTRIEIRGPTSEVRGPRSAVRGHLHLYLAAVSESETESEPESESESTHAHTHTYALAQVLFLAQREHCMTNFADLDRSNQFKTTSSKTHQAEQR